MSFAFKIDKALKANLYKICRLCGIDREEKVEILDAGPTAEQQPVDCDGELKLHQKIIQCIGITVCKDDKMPQSVCVLCVDKINDFYEFREMCYATDVQTRKLLGLKRETQKKNVVADVKPIIDIKEETVVKRGRKRKSDEVIAKEEVTEVKRETNPVPISNKKQRLIEAPTETKKKGKLGKQIDKTLKQNDKTIKQIDKTVKQIDKTIKPKEEIKEEPAAAETEKPSTAPSSVAKFRQVCNICDQRFGSKVKLEQHVATTHLPNIPRYVCTACNETIKKTNDIKSHQLWHKLSKTPYMCGHCGQSLISSYAYSRHLRDHTVEIPPNLWVLDRECPQCHHTFLTNFLYNTHTCAVKTKKCAGCNRQLRNEVEYQRHAAHCNKVYLNYSKHIPAAAAAAESTIRIKNENDVEAAAAEALARSSGISLNMAPVVSLTRISTPEIMAASQGNSVAEYTNESAVAPNDDAKTPTKKGGKKGVSRKDLKRVDNLLKSTLDALVSIKHEPEVHVETDAETPAPIADETANKEKESGDTDHDTFHHDDDFHHGDNNDDENDEENRDQDIAISTRTNEIAIKQEPAEENVASAAINVKQEVIDVENENTAPAAKMPVLKLKIKKEHGTLNSSIVEEQNVRVEKKKKKKKRKELERKGDKTLDGNEQTPENTAVQQESEATAEDLPHTSILRPIKQERLDEGDEEMEGNGTDGNEGVQPGATVMTTIPIPQFQISAISSGVEFGDNTTTAVEGEADVETSDTAAVTTPEMTTDEGEMEDIKPNRAELDRLFKITCVSSGVQMEQETECTIEIANAATTTSLVPEQAAEDSVASVDEIVQKKAPRSALKAVKHKASVQKPRPSTQTRAAKAFKSTAGVRKINVNTLGISNESNIGDYTQIKIKPEPVDRGYEDVFNAYEAATNSSEPQEEPLNEGLSIREIAEQEYLSNIDFTTVQIKQEKDLDVSDVEMTNTHIVASAIPNGMKRSHGEESQYSGNEEDTDSMDNEETEDDDDDDDEDDDNDDDDWVGIKKEEEEKREYRELELPPLLSTEEPETHEMPPLLSTEEQEAPELPSLLSTEEDETTKMPPLLSTEEQETPEMSPLLSTEEHETPEMSLLSTEEHETPEMSSLLPTEEHETPEMSSLLFTEEHETPEKENVDGDKLQCDLNSVSFACPSGENLTAISAIENAASTLLTDNTSKPNEAELPPPFMITGIYSQADCGVSNQFPSLTDIDIPLAETGFSNAIMGPPIEAPTLKIASVMAGCSVNFDDFSKHVEEESISESEVVENFSQATDGEAMQVDDVDESGGINLLVSAANRCMTDEPMEITSTAQTLCLEINQDKDSLLNAQPFSDVGSEAVNAVDTSHIMFNTNMNMDLDIPIQPNPENVVEEAQNVLNHEVFEAQAIQRLTLEVTEATQNVEEAENLMNECVAEAQLQQQQVQHTDTQSGIRMRLNDPESEKSCSSSNESIGGAGSSSGSGIGSASGSIGTLSQSTLINRPFMLDDSNINEIAENNNNANIERELQDDVAATNAANTIEANVAAENSAEEQSNAAVIEIKTNDIT